MNIRRHIVSLAAAFALLPCLSFAQSTGTLTETVNQRNTLGVLTAAPNSSLTAGETVNFSYVLHTAGAPAPTSETVQFYDAGTAIGSAQSIGSEAGTNLLPYAQISAANGWTTSGTAPTITANAVNGPDGSTNTATQIAFAASPSRVRSLVTAGAYASHAMTLSVWAESASATTLTLIVKDYPNVSASGTNTCAVTSTWQRCTLTYSFPANAGTGFEATFASAAGTVQTINLWGAQLEQAAIAGPFVSTIGTALTSGEQGATASLSYSLFHDGSHTITVVYGGDSNFVGSTSNTVTLTVGQATPGIVLTASPVTPSTYGQSITFTATLSPPASDPTNTPTGSVQFFDGVTSLGTGTLSSGVTTVTLSGAGSLGGGTHSITAVYGGNTDYATVTSSAMSYVVNKASASVTVTVTSSTNPSIYGDRVKVTMVVATSIGAAIPTGSVAIVDGVTSLGSVTLDGTGTGILTVPLFSAGTHSLTITYSGDANYQ